VPVVPACVQISLPSILGMCLPVGPLGAGLGTLAGDGWGLVTVGAHLLGAWRGQGITGYVTLAFPPRVTSLLAFSGA
jgi:hypothetical protein